MFRSPRSLFNKYGLYNDIGTISIMETEQLIKQALAGDQQAITTLYNAYSQKMVEVCNRVVGDRFIAEELAHDAFWLAIAKLNQLSDPNRFGQWLSSITHHIATRYVRRDRTPLTASISDLSDKEIHQTPSLHCEDKSHELPSIEEIMAAVDRLPKGYGKVFRMSVIQGMSHTEIAEILGIAAHSSSSQLARAKKLLRKALSSYWVLLFALLLVPLAVIILRQFQRKDSRQPIITKQEEPNTPIKGQSPDKNVPNDTTNRSDSTHLAPTPIDSTNNTPIPPRYIINREYISPTPYFAKKADTGLDSVISPSPIDTIHNIAEQKHLPDTIITDSSVNKKQNILPPFQPKRDEHITDNGNDSHDDFTLPISKKNNGSKWALNLAYTGDFGHNANKISPYAIPTTPPAHTGWPPPDSDITNDIFLCDTWGELWSNLDYWKSIYEFGHVDYYEQEGPDLTKEELDALCLIAEANVMANNGDGEIKRESHHELPFSFSLSLQHRLTPHWSIETGLSYSRLSSQFTIGEPQAGIIDYQKIHYVGLPLKVSYNWLNSNQWSLYSSLGLTLEYPVYTSFSTDFMLNGKSILHQSNSIDMPMQWSTGLGIGLQYNVTPHFGIFAEPNFYYYIPNGSGIETFRTQHPFSISLPIGFRFTW
ncbi:MAG: sigma-70 family RNA polymerase sigma factor [Muribaculaceae bacterium]|nr:sigma-70 family RNA polymerase sigma factor [Muribaculaceae bacterium]